ncbi:helix-turn-helix transcriptional regulator [Roseiflexus castenholzii]|jgi:DNA-binding NarL/FixJ family response regulator|uniref:Transcriptional regulator, LuxR family n=1 Tax=Roseiflexus castenholzii (strain DSM 13941 / HLO8) TaxID=383372 RepID=A7NIM5_ROSCS|nr:response regulator transcription factor [Roseiflexus castenholzii]ABU57325.1 transcriptional regulator, LuxR family [Roseiflexus castenholzii DSM 13941]
MIRVLIVAPTPALRAGLRALLTAANVEIIDAIGSLVDLSGIAADIDVILAADESVLADADQVLAEEPRYAALLLSDDPRQADVLRGLPLTAWGILTHDVGAAELAAALHAVAQGLIVLAPNLAARLLQARQSPVEEPTGEPLTARERDVLELVSQGLSNKQIAQKLHISEHTVKFHLSSLFAKLGVSSRTEAVNRGARQGIITL